MKKMLLIAAALFGMIAVTQTHAQVKKAAIISVFGNKNLSDNPLETKVFEELLKDSSFDISGTVMDFEKIIMDEMVPRFTFPFTPKEEVVNNAAYQALSPSLVSDEEEGSLEDWFNPYVPADGYKNIAAFGIWNDKKSIEACFEMFPDVDAVMIAYVDFNLYDAVGAMGMSSKKVYAYCNIKMFDRDGKRIFKLKERASSRSGVMAVGGFVTSPDKLKPMIAEASEELLIDMQKKIVKSVEKMAKKLAKKK